LFRALTGDAILLNPLAFGLGGFRFFLSFLLLSRDPLCGGLCFFNLLGFFGGNPIVLGGLRLSRSLGAFGLGELGFFLGCLFLGCDARFFRSLCLRRGLCLIGRLRAFGCESRLFLGGELVALGLRQLRIKSIGIRRKEEVPCLSGADSFGEFVVAPDGGVGIEGRVYRRRRNGRERAPARHRCRQASH
jgi:hypothetical protein